MPTSASPVATRTKPNKPMLWVLFVFLMLGGLLAAGAALGATFQPHFNGVVQSGYVDSSQPRVPIIYTVLLANGQQVQVPEYCYSGKTEAPCMQTDISRRPTGSRVEVRKSYDGPYEFLDNVSTIAEYCGAGIALFCSILLGMALFRKNNRNT